MTIEKENTLLGEEKSALNSQSWRPILGNLN